MFRTEHTVNPYLDTAPPDYPRSVEFQIDERATVRVVSVERDGTRIVRFEAGPYRQGAGAWSRLTFAEDIIGFAVAYVERPEEFDREISDVEQINAHWWRTHGEVLS